MFRQAFHWSAPWLRLQRLFGKQPSTAWFSHPEFLRHEPGSEHPDSPARIRVIEEELRSQKIWLQLHARVAGEVSDTQLALVHTRNYLRMLENHLPQQGKIYRLDDDTVMSHSSLSAARLASGAVIGAVNEVMNRRAWNAYCAVRPPGHHAESNKAGGFCLINHLAVGAMHAVATYRLQRIALIDFDVHRGNGIEEIFKDDPRMLLLGMSQNSLFPYQAEMMAGSNQNRIGLDLPAGATSRVFRELVRSNWLPRLVTFKPDLVLISAGFDAHRREPLSDTELHEADFAWLTHKIMQASASCKGRVVSVLEGGYQLEALAKSAAAHIHVLAGLGKPECAIIYDKMLRMENGPLIPESLQNLTGSLKNTADDIRRRFEALREKQKKDDGEN